MHFGLCTISNKDLPVDEVLRVAADAGYDGVEIWGKEPHVGDGSRQVTASVAATASDLSLDIAAYGSYLVAGSDSFRDEYERELAVAERLGADLLRVWPGESEYGDCTESEWEAAVADLSLLADRAAADLAVTVEKHEGRLSDATEGARRLIEAVDHPNCGLNWQPLFHMDETALLAEAERLAPLSNNVHVQARRAGELPARSARGRLLRRGGRSRPIRGRRFRRLRRGRVRERGRGLRDGRSTRPRLPPGRSR